MRTEDTDNKAAVSEQLNADEARVAEMLGGLRRVEAPGDFEFYVKARIAQAAPADITPSPLFGRLKIFAPLALVLMVAGFVGFNEFFSSRPNNGTVVAEQPHIEEPTKQFQQGDSVAAVPEPNNSLTQPEANRDNSDRDEVASGPRGSDRARKTIGNSDTGGGSKTVAGRGTSAVINPPGINPNPPTNEASATPPEGIAKTTAREFLSLLGIDAEPGTGGWKVTSFKANSPADHSGVKTGDLIEALDDRKLEADSAFTGNFVVKTLKVLRDGKSLTIVLKK
jgi:hypothetical protein